MDVWEFIHRKKTSSVDVALLYVLASKGSSPGRQGFKMAVSSDGECCGTIGGGIMEHKFVEKAKAELVDGLGNTGIYQQVHDKAALKHQSGMICSGEQTIFFHHIQQSDLKHIAALLRSLKKNENGSLELTISGINFSKKIPSDDFYLKKHEADFLLVEKTGYKNQLHIIGGGHCSLALSKLMKELGFYVHVYDERNELHTMQQNPHAHQKTTLTAYSDLGQLLTEGNNVYVIIMTAGYRSDNEALTALSGKNFRYLGLLGSKTKVKKLLDNFREGNLDAGLIKKIHSPAGLQIKSRTATEIAVSIAAEIILIKNLNQ